VFKIDGKLFKDMVRAVTLAGSSKGSDEAIIFIQARPPETLIMWSFSPGATIKVEEKVTISEEFNAVMLTSLLAEVGKAAPSSELSVETEDKQWTIKSAEGKWQLRLVEVDWPKFPADLEGETYTLRAEEFRDCLYDVAQIMTDDEEKLAHRGLSLALFKDGEVWCGANDRVMKIEWKPAREYPDIALTTRHVNLVKKYIDTLKVPDLIRQGDGFSIGRTVLYLDPVQDEFPLDLVRQCLEEEAKPWFKARVVTVRSVLEKCKGLQVIEKGLGVKVRTAAPSLDKGASIAMTTVSLRGDSLDFRGEVVEQFMEDDDSSVFLSIDSLWSVLTALKGDEIDVHRSEEGSLIFKDGKRVASLMEMSG